jgi:hypothetical protein
MSFGLLGVISASLAGGGPAGYFAGGVSSGYLATTNKFAFPSDVQSLLVATLSIARGNAATFADSGVAGYVCGGWTGAARGTWVDKLAFAGDTYSTLGTGISTATNVLAGMANSGTAGYSAGGYTAAGNATTVDKFAFPGDSRSTLGTGLSAATSNLAAMANSSVAGYFGGGQTTTKVTTIDKFAFPGDSRSTLGTGLTAGVGDFAGMADSGVAGYFGGGALQWPASNYSTTVDKIAFPSDTKSTLGTGLPTAINQLGGMADSGTAGYFAGGYFGSAPYIKDEVTKFTFPSETRSTLGTGLNTTLYQLDGFANGNI